MKVIKKPVTQEGKFKAFMNPLRVEWPARHSPSMEQVNTLVNIHVNPFEFEELLELKIQKRLNDHAYMSLSGIIPEGMQDEYAEHADENKLVTVCTDKDGEDYTLFTGLILEIDMSTENGLRKLELTAVSCSMITDKNEMMKSYQDAGQTYESICKEKICAYPRGEIIDYVSDGKAIGDLIVQYKETDWEFLKRLASHFHAPLVVDAKKPGPHIYFGLQVHNTEVKLGEYKYVFENDIWKHEKDAKKEGGEASKDGGMAYKIRSGQILELCAKVNFKNRTLYVSNIETVYEKGQLLHYYTLASKARCSQPKLFNRDLAGVSLFGKILEISKDTVKLHLEIDGNQDKGSAKFFPYATVYSSPDGTGWYCMPEEGDKCRLYFPDDEESNAFSASSVNLQSSNPDSRSSPDDKSISTKYGKSVRLTPEGIFIQSGDELYINITDENGIEMMSDKKIKMESKDEVSIESTDMGDIKIEGKEGITIKKDDGIEVNIVEDVTITGGQVRME